MYDFASSELYLRGQLFPLSFLLRRHWVHNNIHMVYILIHEVITIKRNEKYIVLIIIKIYPKNRINYIYLKNNFYYPLINFV